MNKRSVLAMVSLLIIPTAYAEIDWSPKLTELQDSCSTVFHVMDEIPNQYQRSIIKKYDTTVKDKYSGNNITTTYRLKNATAFGVPLVKIEEDINDSDMHSKGLSLTFKNTDFMKLRTSFYYTAKSEYNDEYKITMDSPASGHYRKNNIDVKFKNTKLGYQVEDHTNDYMSCWTSLNFDKTKRTLSCSMSCG